MEKSSELTPEERAKITEIQDLLIDRYVALKSAMEKGDKARSSEIEFSIDELKREIEGIKERADVPA